MTTIAGVIGILAGDTAPAAGTVTNEMDIYGIASSLPATVSNTTFYVKDTAGNVAQLIAIAGVTSLTSPNGTITLSASTGVITEDLTAVITAGGPTGAANTVPVLTYNKYGQLTLVTTATITPAAIGAPVGSGTSTGSNSGDLTLAAVGSAPTADGASLAGQVLTLQPANTSNPGLLTAIAQSIGGAKTLTAALFPKDIEGRVYVDPANTQGWAGSDAGAWINAAYSYISTTYSSTNGGIIELAPGSYSYSTPIVLANAGLMTIILRGAGDGNGSTILNYTATSGIALAVGGGSGNDGGVQLENFTITGTALGNGATAVQFGVSGVANVAGATVKNVSIRRFTNGFAHLNGNSYGITFINCKVQQCTNGYTPLGENNNWHGGLLGGNTTGLVASNACEYQLFGVAFDDNTTTGVNSSSALARGTLDGCRFENAGLGTDTYITISAGSIVQNGGGMQNDITAAGTSTGFVQASGGLYTCLATWLESAAGSSRTYTQIFNLSGTVIAHIDPVIAPVGAITGTTQLCTAGYAARRIDWLRLSNNSTAVQTISALGAAPGTYLTNSNINVPATAIVGVAVGTCFEWTFKMSKSAVGTGNFSFIFYAGTNGTTGDTAVVTVNLTQTAVVDDAFITATLVCATAGSSGTLTGMVSGQNKAATATGFGFVIGTSGPAAVTSSAFNLTTSALKFGMALASATGTPAVTVSNVKARVYNLD